MIRNDRRLLFLASGIAIASACTNDRDLDRVRKLPEALRAETECPAAAPMPAATRDSSVVLCVPRDFIRGHSGHSWGRGGPGDTSRAWFSVSMLDSAAVSLESEGRWWPPSFRHAPGFTIPDGYIVDSLVTHYDTAGETAIAVETGLVTGGISGERRAPALLAAWAIAPWRWMLVQARVTRPATLDTLRVVIHSVHARFNVH